jgi:hypothetical protein
MALRASWTAPAAAVIEDLTAHLLAIELELWKVPPDASYYEQGFDEAGLMILPMESGVLD